MKDDLISVVIPVYNSADFLDRCVQSVVKQSYPKWELILVDDGSTDNSGALCDTYAEKYQNVFCVHQKNRGVSVARNVGINACHGKLLCFVDSDDVISEEYLEHLKSVYEKYNCDWTLTAVGPYQKIKLHEKIILDFANLSGDDFLRLNEEYVLYGPYCKLYKVELIKKYQIHFQEGIHYGEDLMFNFSYMEHIRSAVFWNVNDYSYENVSDASLSSKYRKTMFEDELRLANVKISFYKKKKVYNAAFKRFVYDGIFDMGYNAILKTYFAKNCKDIKGYVFNILNNEMFHEAAKNVPNGKYAPYILFAMRHKIVYGLLLYLKLYEFVEMKH